MTHNKSVQK